MDTLKDTNEQDKSRFAALRLGLTKARRNAGKIIGITVLALIVTTGSAVVGYQLGTHKHEHEYQVSDLPPIHDNDWPPATLPQRVCGAPSPLNPGTETHEPTETLPPTEPCVAPTPDIIVLVGANKAKALPAAVGGIDCEMTGDYDLDYSACDPRPASDVASLVKKLLTPEQLAFVNDHVVSSTEDAHWAFDIKDTADLKNRYMVPGAAYDESTSTITVYIW